MKTTPKIQKLPVGLLIIGLLLVIIGYNYWSYRCGFCTVSSLMSLSTPAVLLLLLNIVAGGVLLGIKARNRRLLQGQHCRCGSALRSSWAFCPACGVARQQQPN
jgi:uncharacterized integral membrane protein